MFSSLGKGDRLRFRGYIIKNDSGDGTGNASNNRNKSGNEKTDAFFVISAY